MIELVNVYKVYENGTRALNNISLRIDEGEFVFIEGSSGAGKSTLLKLLMHEIIPSSGEVRINGYDLMKIKNKEIPYLRRTMGVVFQDFRLIPTMTIFDNVAFAMRVTGSQTRLTRRRVPYILGLVGLSQKARNFPHELSGGEQQRTALARALVNNPSLIIADEPTGNIDPQMSLEIVELLNEINRRGTTVLMITHETELVKSFDKRIITLHNGSVVSDQSGGVQ